MDKERGNKGVIGLLIVIIVVLVVLCVLLATGKISFNGDVECNTNSIIDTNQADDNVNNDNKNTSYVFSLDGYKNIDGTYGYIKSLNFVNWNKTYEYNITLRTDGNVYISDDVNNREIGNKLNVSNIVDIISFNNSPGSLGYCYLLDESGNVYLYDLSEYMNGSTLDVKVIDSVSDIRQLIIVHYCPLQNAGCSWELLAIKNDGSSVSLNKGSV